MLFADSQVMGTFKGFNDRGLEFAAEIVAPYDSSMLDRPQLGQFLLIELGNEEEAALGRITRFVPTGLLATAEGEDYVNTMQRRQQEVPEDLKKQRLKYRVQVKLLGAVKVKSGTIIYVPSQRRLPHLGARVALPSAAVLQRLCELSEGSTDLGNFVLGEFIYAGAAALQADPALLSIDPKLIVKFDIKKLVSRRSVVFARAGYGKSNLVKFLVSELYRETPRSKSGLPVGTIIFDPDGEYFWPDRVDNRPGFCDVPHLQDKLVLFSNRPAPSPYYGSWLAGTVRLDIRDIPPRDVIGIALTPDRQTQQNVLKLKGVGMANWRLMVDLIKTQGLQASDNDIGRLMGYAPAQIPTSTGEIGAARSNMFGIVSTLHDPNSTLLNGAIQALSRGSIVIVDISLLSSGAGNMLAGLVLRRIFSHNQEHFTGGHPIIPVVAIMEEAQSVLGRNLDDTSPYVEWVKEGRKYDLGAMLVTQQPGSMAPEIMSQADNWFCFHLLSEGDAMVLGKYNSHYSSDVLAHLIAEPITGNCFMWSAPHQPFVLPVRLRDFGAIYKEYIKDSAHEKRIENTGTRQMEAAVSESLTRLKDALIHSLKTKPVKWVRVPNALPDGKEGVGVYTGQLYHLIKEIKTDADTQKEDELKGPLLTLILGQGALHIAERDDREYYCSTQDSWEKSIGAKIHAPP